MRTTNPNTACRCTCRLVSVCALAVVVVWTVPPAWSADAGTTELERELLDKLREHLKAQQRDDPLARAGDRMRRVQRRLDEADGGTKTREIQKQIVADLEEAIKRMQQQRRSPKNQAQRKKKKVVQNKVPQPKPQPAKKQPKRGGRKPTQKPGRGTARRGGRRPPASVRAEDWGFLPEVLRDEILQRFKEGYLQSYRELLEQYYISLSEKGRVQADR